MLTGGMLRNSPSRAVVRVEASNDDGVSAAGATTGIDDIGHGIRLGADHGDIEAPGNAFHRPIALLAEHGLVFRIDKKQFTFVARVEHVAHQRDANRVGRLRGADDGDRFWFEKGVQVVLLVMHGGAPQRRLGVWSEGLVRCSKKHGTFRLLVLV